VRRSGGLHGDRVRCGAEPRRVSGAGRPPGGRGPTCSDRGPGRSRRGSGDRRHRSRSGRRRRGRADQRRSTGPGRPCRGHRRLRHGSVREGGVRRAGRSARRPPPSGFRQRTRQRWPGRLRPRRHRPGRRRPGRRRPGRQSRGRGSPRPIVSPHRRRHGHPRHAHRPQRHAGRDGCRDTPGSRRQPRGLRRPRPQYGVVTSSMDRGRGRDAVRVSSSTPAQRRIGRTRRRHRGPDVAAARHTGSTRRTGWTGKTGSVGRSGNVGRSASAQAGTDPDRADRHAATEHTFCGRGEDLVGGSGVDEPVPDEQRQRGQGAGAE
jgi:hypothetical protein